MRQSCKISSTLVTVLLTLISSFVFARESLQVMAWPGYADADLVEIFESRYSVDVEVTLIDTDDEMWRRLAVEKFVNFDVFAVNVAQLQRYINHGVSIPLNLANIPNTNQQLARFRDLSAIPGLIREGKAYAIPYTYSEMGLIYDRKVFPKPPHSFSLMWDKRFHRRVLMYAGGEHNFSLAALVLGIKNPFQIPDDDFPRVSLYLAELRRNVLTYYQKPDEASNLFMQNQVALLFANYGSQQVTLLQKSGADIGYIIPKEGALAWLDCWSVTRFAENKALAEAWINFTLEATVSHALSVRQGLPNTLEESPALGKAGKVIWLQQAENVARRGALWDKIISGELPEEIIK